MRVVITGATGFAGRHLASTCFREQVSALIGLGRRPAAEADAPPELGSYEAVDLTDAEQAVDVIRRTKPDRVFHLAAEASVASSWSEPARLIVNNVSSTLNLLEAVRLHAPAARVLVACSGEEYGEPQWLPVTEDHPLNPVNPYAFSKASLDSASGFYADAYGLRVVRARAFNHAGPGQSDAYVVSSIARQIAEAESLQESGTIEVAIGNVEVRRDFTDVRDVTCAYWLALERAEPGAYNICSGRSVAISDILTGLAGHSRLEVRPRTDPERLRGRDVADIRGSHDRLTGATDWRPEIPLEQTLRDALDWWRAQTRAGVAS